MMSLRGLRCMPVLCVIYVICYVGIVPLSSVATEFDERVKDYRNNVQSYFDRRNVSDPHNTIYSTPLDYLNVNNNTCVLEGRSRYLSNYESFVFIDGEDVPQDAVIFAGVFDLNDILERAVFRGMYLECRAPSHLL